MTIAPQKLSFSEYLTYINGTEIPYELVDGELRPMSLGTGKHGNIIHFLTLELSNAESSSRSWVVLPGLVGIRSPRGRRWETSRIPDITVMDLAQWEAMENREAVIEFNEPPPHLVVEVVSESTRTDDYRSKRNEYALLEIPEYWIVDPLENKVLICILDHQLYDSIEFSGTDRIQSPIFPNLDLTTDRVLAGKR
ncbi:MAG TPA: Uma2 family endonuclease [Oscillatoriales cyanobacterium M59_W2019_021]|nr:MAG: Uma2 family endonuclease [Cyanobacteria bacterium J055]HIK32959.1 Uma2 family endonuclease [Oscillatoriales cyanobacterium M4454_W2019_049]HIK52575.1 Uma2 family endonuclease [Oscillatoriales cyanobacterium M59_W2019_021]